MTNSIATTCDFVANLNQIDDAGQRCAWWLENTYRDSRAKRIARDFDVSDRTARLWLAGKLPAAEYLDQMAKRFGWRFINFVLGRMPIDLRMDNETEVLRARAARQKQENNQDGSAVDLDRPQNAAPVSHAEPADAGAARVVDGFSRSVGRIRRGDKGRAA